MRELSVTDLHELLQDGGKPQLLDVRDHGEVARGMLPGAIHIPLSELSERHGELSAFKPVVAYCHHGARSARAVEFLNRVGFADAANLIGGADAWSRQIDPSLPLY